ncbi:MAG: GEVED domain-containing protein [Bacteroidota bacterium]|nr:GEVED domain-containing protein [Bacteroidota bacterium]
MKKTLLTLFTVGLFNFANAQVSAYTFAGSTGTYTAITGGTLLGSTSDDEERFVDPAVPLGGTLTTGVGFPIGFNFTYNGVVFDRLGINTNGWISLGQSSLTPSVNMASASSFTVILSQTSTATPTYLRSRIAGLARDLESQTGSSLRIETTGTSPNKVCVIQWTNYAKFNATGDNYNFQIRLKETSNNIEVAYGSFTSSATIAYAQVGLGGSTNTDFNNRQTTTSWTATTAGTLNTDTCRLSSTVKPTSGQIFTWTPPPACTGTPTVGTASGPSGACSGIGFDLVLTGFTPNVSGLTFQWQSSTTSGGTYSNISGATTSTYTATQTATMYYKCLVSCSGGTAVASNIVTVTLTAPSACYCIPASTNCLTTDKITNVTISTINSTTTCGTNGYSAYTTPTATFNQAVSYPITVTVGSTSQYVGVWIDYDQNGTFDASEFTYLGTGSLTITSAIVIPGTATIGATKMRVRTRWLTTLTGADACLAYTYGETEDYAVTIAAGTSCTGTPTAGTASATDSVCNGETFDLILTGYTSGVAGITFQWQSSPTSGGTYTNITGATTSTYAATQTATTYYKCAVTCSGGTPVNSNVVTVILKPIMNCYCTSTATSISDEEIFNVTVGTLNNTSSCTTTGGPGSVLKMYSNYTAVAAPTLSRTAANTFSVTIGTCGTTAYTSAFKIYIDYNKNGSFAEAGETVYTSDTATALTYTKSGTFTVPTSAASGNTLMRVVNTETDFPYTIDSCGTYSYGETEDYLVNIPSLVGIEENEILNTISVYPNPTTGLFNITTSNANFTQLTISVIDIQGKEVFNTSDKNYSANYNKQINLDGLAKGIYYIRLTTGDGVKTQKLIIQ